MVANLCHGAFSCCCGEKAASRQAKGWQNTWSTCCRVRVARATNKTKRRQPERVNATIHFRPSNHHVSRTINWQVGAISSRLYKKAPWHKQIPIRQCCNNLYTDVCICVLSPVDLASVDRRDNERQEETLERVKGLANAYSSSAMHKDVVYEIIEDTMKPTTGRQLLAQKIRHYRPQQSSFFRTLFTLLG